MRHQGKITNWKDDRGFGFISPNNGDSHQVFVHIKSFANQQKRPIGNEIVTYTLKTDAKGRSQAVNVLFDGDHVLLPIVSWSSNVLPILTDTFSLLLSVAF
ncbi:MAG: cold shock domain-containing protein, partial [Proteobacteria bacterium]|nr:cold shock domain-containing protein [Pseudomonadota bacterium]